MYGITNAGAGAAGGLSANAAVLHVRASVGSTVTATNGSVTKTVTPQKAHTDSGDGKLAVYLFSVATQNYGTWTVTASNGSKTKSATVTISSNKEYDIDVSFIQYIYRRGNVYKPELGGWSGNGLYMFEVEYLDVAPTSGTRYTNLWTNAKIDVTVFTKLVFVWEGSFSCGTGGTNLMMWVANSQISNMGVSSPTGATLQDKLGGNNDGTIVLGTRQINVTTLSGSYYIGFHAGLGGGTGDSWSMCHLLEAYLEY